MPTEVATSLCSRFGFVALVANVSGICQMLWSRMCVKICGHVSSRLKCRTCGHVTRSEGLYYRCGWMTSYHWMVAHSNPFSDFHWWSGVFLPSVGSTYCDRRWVDVFLSPVAVLYPLALTKGQFTVWCTSRGLY